jgi:PAS domain S-box-containing protein
LIPKSITRDKILFFSGLILGFGLIIVYLNIIIASIVLFSLALSIFAAMVLERKKTIQRISEIETEDSKSKNDLSLLEKRYTVLYETSPDLYRTINSEGIILDCNKAYAENLGYAKEEAIGMSIFDHTLETSFPAIQSSYQTWKKDGIVKNREMWLKRKNGSTFPVLLSATTVYDTKGNALSSTIMKDMTEIVEARRIIEDRENLIKKQLVEIKQIEIQKDEFMCMITHELKTPLFPIEAHCEMLSDPSFGENLSEDQKESIQEIYKNSKILESLIGDVLEPQKIEMRKLSFRKDSFRVSGFVVDLVKSFKPVLDEKKIELVIANYSNAIIHSDMERLNQVFRNIIANAMDFVPKGKGRIEIGTTENKSELIFYIKDNGIGISEEKQVNLFKKFYQIDTKIDRKHGGNGLGLVICKGIVEQLGGKIWVESKMGSGSTFYFSMPKKSSEVKIEEIQLDMHHPLH